MNKMSMSYPLYKDLLKFIPRISKYFEVKNINSGQKEQPLLKLSTIQFPSEPLIIIMAGVHGEELAPPLTLFKYYADFYKKALRFKVNLVIYPLVNPWGFNRDKRCTKENLNCADNWVHKKEGDTARNVRLLREELKDDTKSSKEDIVFIDLHEDIDTKNSFFLYSFGERIYEKPLLRVAKKYFPIAHDNSLEGLKRGVIYEEHDGSAEDFMSHQKGVVFSCCTETPLHGPLSLRIACNKAIIETIIRLAASR